MPLEKIQGSADLCVRIIDLLVYVCRDGAPGGHFTRRSQ